MLTFALLLICCAATALYLFVKNRHEYWARKEVPYLKPANFIMGTTSEVLLKKHPLYTYHEMIYNKLSPHRYGGYFNFFSPVLIIRDPELIKNILTKDFAYFMNRGNNQVDENDPLSMHLFNLEGERWKTLRTKLTPTFTSGKIKVMFNLMQECTDDLLKVIDGVIEGNDAIEIKEMMARYTTDVISSCVFGLQPNTQQNTNSDFRNMGKKIFQVTRWSFLIALMNSFTPKLRRILGIKMFDSKLRKFFSTLVVDTVRYREENDVHRSDFLDLLISLRKQETLTTNENSKFEFTNNLMTAQCFVFFVAGFETSSGTLSFALYELAKHKEIQDKLFEEIAAVINEFNGKLTYDSLQKMTYLDQVINETLRMYPLLPILFRICHQNFQLDSKTTIEKNTRVLIPVKGLHYDPQYFENPLEFNPENFTKEAKSRRHHYCYLPFGEGPRICIGMRFGLMQVKLGLATIINNFEVTLLPRMHTPLKFAATAFLPTLPDGMWLDFRRRSTKTNKNELS